jgi:hypothetical protein
VGFGIGAHPVTLSTDVVHATLAWPDTALAHARKQRLATSQKDTCRPGTL